jgi:hypothetical protein
VSKNILETAIDLHRELSQRGLELNPRIGRDKNLFKQLATDLKLPEKGFSKALEKSEMTAEKYLASFIKLAQPFARMFKEIWTYLSKNAAPKADENILIRFGFSEKDSDINWNDFRIIVESANKILQLGFSFELPIKKFFELERILSKDLNRQNAKYLGYKKGSSMKLPEVKSNVDEEWIEEVKNSIQNSIDLINQSWGLESKVGRELPEFEGLNLFEETSNEINRLNTLANQLTDLVPIWTNIFSNWNYISEIVKKSGKVFFEHEIKANIKKTKRLTLTPIFQALDILDLPFWKYRWHTYEIWSTIKALEALEVYSPKVIVKNGRILLDVTSPALIAILAGKQKVFAQVQAETKLPTRFIFRKAIRPDLRFAFDNPASNENSIAIVEFKQRKKLTPRHTEEVLNAYLKGVNKKGGVIIINYDNIPIVKLPDRCYLFGNVNPSEPNNVSNYQETLRKFFKDNGIRPISEKRYVLLDVSISMEHKYTGKNAQMGLRQILQSADLKIFRFNDGLLPGGDLQEVSKIHISGGTQLGATLEQLFELEEGGIPDRLLIVTDGEHDKPSQQLSRIKNWQECMPEEIISKIQWLLE